MCVCVCVCVFVCFEEKTSERLAHITSIPNHWRSRTHNHVCWHAHTQPHSLEPSPAYFTWNTGWMTPPASCLIVEWLPLYWFCLTTQTSPCALSHRPCTPGWYPCHRGRIWDWRAQRSSPDARMGAKNWLKSNRSPRFPKRECVCVKAHAQRNVLPKSSCFSRNA